MIFNILTKHFSSHTISPSPTNYGKGKFNKKVVLLLIKKAKTFKFQNQDSEVPRIILVFQKTKS